MTPVLMANSDNCVVRLANFLMKEERNVRRIIAHGKGFSLLGLIALF